MLKNPRLKNSYRVGLIDKGTAILLAENSEKIVDGELLCSLLAAMEEGRSSDDIADALSHRYDLAEVYFGIAELERLGIAEEASGNDTPEAVFWGLLGRDGHAALERLADARVAVVSVGEDASSLMDMLRHSGIPNVDAAQLNEPNVKHWDLTVVVARNYRDERLQRLNRIALANNHRWMLTKPSGLRPWIGPLFIPHETGCWRCLEERLRYNDEVSEFIKRRYSNGQAPSYPVGTTGTSAELAQNITAIAVCRLLADDELAQVKGKLLSFDWKTFAFTTHHLVRLPDCPDCGTGLETDAPHPSRPTLLSRRKRFRLDGGHRVVTPETILERHGHLMSEITGIATPMVEATAECFTKSGAARSGAISYYRTTHASVGRIRRLEDLKKGLRAGTSAGKGLTRIQAKTSCLCEAIERVSGIFRGTEYRVHVRYGEVAETAIHPRDLLLFSDKQYSERSRWAGLDCAFTRVPVRFDESHVIDWSPAWSLTNKVWKLVPTAYLYYGYNEDPETAFCVADSNGCAAGGCLEEAILQGLLELIERDAVALWWYNMIPFPALDLESVRDPMIAQFLETLAAAGRTAWVLDISSDLPVSVFAACSSEMGNGPDRPVLGFGAHLDPRVALTRALSEMIQSLGIIDFPSELLYDNGKLSLLKRFTEETKLARTPYLIPAVDLPVQRFESYRDASSDDLLTDLRHCVDMLRERGLETLVHDQTRPDLGLNVAKVIVPGLRHFWARYAQGRLYDVPVSMGWVREPTPEEKLNPIPVFL